MCLCRILQFIFMQIIKILFYGTRVFDEKMTVRSVGILCLTGYCSTSEKAKDCAFDAFVFFKEMVVGINGVKPNHSTMDCVLSAISQMGVLEIGACVRGIWRGLFYLPENDVFIGTALVDIY